MEQEDWIYHLTEVRKRLIVVAVWFVATLCTGLYISPAILRFIKSRHSADQIEWNVFSFTDGILIYMKCALLFAVMLTLPLLLYQLWAFVKPGLSSEEAKRTWPYIPAAFALFLFGLTFSYVVVFPMMLQFMKKMNRSIGAVETYGIDRYFAFLFDIVFPMAIAFEMPVVMMFLTRIGLLTPQRIKATRKYAYVGLAITGSCISPPDMVSHLSVTVPLILLFEISVFVSNRQFFALRRSAANS